VSGFGPGLDYAQPPESQLDPHWEPQPEPEQHRGHLRMAERVIREQGNDLRHVHGIGWHVWDGSRWAEDEDDEPTRRVIATIKSALAEMPDLAIKDRKDLMSDINKAESAAGISGVLSITGSLLPVSVSHKRMDVDPGLFNTPSGTVNLRTSEVVQHRRDDHITKVSAADIGDQDDEVWMAFLERVLPDEDVRLFVQRLIGYSMLGEVQEHVMPIFTGTGANGKGTIRDAIMHAFGDYAAEIDPEMLMESKHVRHGTFKMQLRGRRLVFCSETERGRRFAEATMKRLVGGDPIEANRMHKDPITFMPSHTLVMLTNFLPQVSGDDPAVWRRILVVPFDVVIPPEERDGELPRRLKDAAPAVLRWAFQGWQEYQRIGLAPPEAVRARTEEYRAESDALGTFIGESCVENASAHVKARELFTKYEQWCQATHERALSEKEFAKSMSSRGHEKARTAFGQVYRGIGLMHVEEELV
jgi:putative DNA primase/helicase